MKKRMTIREKEYRRRARKQCQEEGLLPPNKPKLNRKQYCRDAAAEWNDQKTDVRCHAYLDQAVGIMLDHIDRKGRVSLEAVGAAKVYKIAVRLQQFYESNEYRDGELYSAINNIMEA